MTKERLQSLPLEELKRFAESRDIDVDGSSDREMLIDLVLEVYQELEQEREEVNNLQIKGEASKYRIGQDEGTELADVPPVPDHYDETKLVALVREPSWAFAYWEIKDDKIHQFQKEGESFRMVLRVHDTTDTKVNGRNSNDHFDIPLKLTDRKWYLNLSKTGSSYVLELLFRRKNKDHVLARSNEIHMPFGGFAEESANDQISEEVLMMSLQPAMREIPGSGTIPQRILSGD